MIIPEAKNLFDNSHGIPLFIGDVNWGGIPLLSYYYLTASYSVGLEFELRLELERPKLELELKLEFYLSSASFASYSLFATKLSLYLTIWKSEKVIFLIFSQNEQFC